MAEAAWLAASVTAAFAGMAWLGLSYDSHWAQVFGDEAAPPTPARQRGLRAAGAAALLLSLLACLAADHASMASLVWVMALAPAALAVALLLAWRPRWLRGLAGPFSSPSR